VQSGKKIDINASWQLIIGDWWVFFDWRLIVRDRTWLDKLWVLRPIGMCRQISVSFNVIVVLLNHIIINREILYSRYLFIFQCSTFWILSIRYSKIIFRYRLIFCRQLPLNYLSDQQSSPYFMELNISAF